MCIEILEIYIIHCYPSILMITAIFQMKKKEMGKKYDPSNLFLRNHKYNEGYKKDEEKKQITAGKTSSIIIANKSQNQFI